MYKCECCGRFLDDDDVDAIQEYRGEFWGFPAYETVSVCGFCHSDDIDWDYDGREDAKNYLAERVAKMGDGDVELDDFVSDCEELFKVDEEHALEIWEDYFEAEVAR